VECGVKYVLRTDVVYSPESRCAASSETYSEGNAEVVNVDFDAASRSVAGCATVSSPTVDS